MKGNLPRKKTDYCKWVFCEDEGYHTSCDNIFIIIEGTPEENDMKYCPYCGKVIK
jgi:hypothetical protein